jgi:hypothetical protein
MWLPIRPFVLLALVVRLSTQVLTIVVLIWPVFDVIIVLDQNQTPTRNLVAKARRAP